MKRKKMRNQQAASASSAENSNNLSQIIRFDYEGNMVGFSNGEKMMVNATEMAKPFGKLTADWLRLQSTNEFINTLSSVRGIPISQLVIVQKGNSSQFIQGTWMHEDAALEFARWLSPRFAIWCNDRIKELLTGKYTKLLEQMAQNLEMMRNRLETLERRMDNRQSQDFGNRRRWEPAAGDYENHDPSNLVLINFQLPKFINRKMKVYCVSNNITIRDFITELIENELRMERIY